MMSRMRPIGVGLLLVVLAVPAWAQGEQQTKDEQIASLTEQRQKLTDNIAEAEKLLQQNPVPGDPEALKKQIDKWQAKLKDIDTQLAALKGEAPKAEDEQNAQKEMAQIRRRIAALLNRMKARQAELEKLAKEQPAAAGGAAEGAPGAPAEPAGEPGMAQPGAGMGMVAGGRRQQREATQREDFGELLQLQARLKQLENAPKTEAKPEEDAAEMHPLALFDGRIEKNPFGLKLGGWGSGIIEEDKAGLEEGLKSLLVYTDGYYRGARIDFAQPPEITRYF
ncbi:MAG: hypothetical protein HYU66_23360, partial [Armatimonadetes bacterium]|nr:hypothetical protein [Armatimonadota bacterium]